MIGYDSKSATEEAIKIHSDGTRWLHTGDIGYMTEDGTIYALTRGKAPRLTWRSCNTSDGESSGMPIRRY